MKALSIFFSKHKYLNLIVCIIAFWGIMLCIDLFRVDAYDTDPLCCIETGNDHFIGLGYSFDITDKLVFLYRNKNNRIAFCLIHMAALIHNYCILLL